MNSPIKSIISLIFIFLATAGCFNEEEENNVCAFNSSTQASIEAIVAELYEPMKNIPILNKKEGEYLHYQTSVNAQGSGSSILLQDYETYLNDIEDEATKTQYHFIQTIHSYFNNEVDRVQKDILQTIAKPLEAQSTYSNFTLKKPTKKPFRFKILSTEEPIQAEACDTGDIKGLSFHYLQTNVTTTKAPERVIENGCPGLQDCNLDVRQVEFKQVYVDEENQITVVNHKFQISPQVPYLNYLLYPLFGTELNPEGLIYNGLVSHCMEYWTSQKIFARECTYLANYQLEEHP